MKKNIGTTDKIVRLIFALFLVILNLTDVITGVSGLYVVIASVVVTVVYFSYCPVYSLLGINNYRGY
jgi:hypothetical protein